MLLARTVAIDDSRSGDAVVVRRGGQFGDVVAVQDRDVADGLQATPDVAFE